MNNKFNLKILSGFFAIMLLICINGVAQKKSTEKKPLSIGVQVFYNDFNTPQLIKSSSFSNVLQTGTWNTPKSMEGGFGITALKGITSKIDAVSSFNLSWVNYQLPNSFLLYGSINTMLDFSLGAHVKVFTDKRSINPYVIAKVGFEKYENFSGFNAQPGVGIQISFLKEIFLMPSIQYKLALGNNTSNQFLYSINLSAPLKKSKRVKEAESNVSKTVTVTINDEATGLPLPNAVVFLNGNDGTKQEVKTDEEGKAIFKNVKPANYTITATLNGIDASVENITSKNFVGKKENVEVVLLHNDPRFTLVGNVVDKSIQNNPVGGTIVSATNTQSGNANTSTSKDDDGEFIIQLEPNSDFIVVGKKANFMSNIEAVTTKGLSRSATLYVKLELAVENAQGKSIVMKNITFVTASANINASSNTDLDKLVQFLKDNPDARLEIQGHTDDVGSAQSNLELSEQRAKAIVNYLESKGINSSMLEAKGLGSTSPIASNKTASGKAKNRRVEMKLIK